MIDPNACCLDEDEFDEKIRVSKDARMKVMGKTNAPKDAPPKDPILEADTKGKVDYLEADEMFMRATRLDVKTIFYLEDRMKNCYQLRKDVNSFVSLLNCFKDATLRQPVDCECDVRSYLREISKEKHDFAEHLSKFPPKKEKGSGKDDKVRGKKSKGKDKPKGDKK